MASSAARLRHEAWRASGSGPTGPAVGDFRRPPWLAHAHAEVIVVRYRATRCAATCEASGSCTRTSGAMSGGRPAASGGPWRGGTPARWPRVGVALCGDGYGCKRRRTQVMRRSHGVAARLRHDSAGTASSRRRCVVPMRGPAVCMPMREVTGEPGDACGHPQVVAHAGACGEGRWASNGHGGCGVPARLRGARHGRC